MDHLLALSNKYKSAIYIKENFFEEAKQFYVN